MTNHSNLVEIFSSIQGEGPYIGVKQLFIRFAECNLNCAYCDTDFSIEKSCKVIYKEEETLYANPVNIDVLLTIIEKFINKVKHHSISLTGGEPLLSSEFLFNFLPLLIIKFPDLKVYLETNGTLNENMKTVLPFVDIVSMDLKIKSSTGVPFPFYAHKNFIDSTLRAKKELFVKAVISSQTTDNEIDEICDLLTTTKPIPLILQPISTDRSELKPTPSQLIEIQDKFLLRLTDVRIIPQTHKYLNLL